MPERRPAGVDNEAARFGRHSIIRSEAIYGEGFQTSGGLRTVRATAAALGLPPGSRVLDIGCGTGGAAIYLAGEYSAEVLGIDNSSDCIALARAYAAAANVQCARFEVADARAVTLPQREFDLVWTRDTLMYVREKDLILKNAAIWLKAGGTFFCTDFCRHGSGGSAKFKAYAEACQYKLGTLAEYRAALDAAGLEVIELADRTPELIADMEAEVGRLRADKAAFLTRFADWDFEHLVERWAAKLRFCRGEDLIWARIIARAPRQGEVSAGASTIID